MAIAFDVITSDTTNYGSGSSRSYSHLGGSGTSRFVAVGTCNANKSSTGGSVNSATYGGVSMSALGAAVTQAAGSARGFVLIAPSTGTQTVAIAYTSPTTPPATSQGMGSLTVTYTGVDQSTGYQNYGTANATNSGPVTKTITSATGNLVVAFACLTESNAALTASTVTERLAGGVAHNINGDPQRLSHGEVAGGASVAATWTIGGAAHWVVLAFDLIADAGGGGGGGQPTMRRLGLAEVGRESVSFNPASNRRGGFVMQDGIYRRAA